MGNQTKAASKYADNHQWLTIATSDYKELLQNKLSRQIVEKHQLKQAGANLIKYDHLVYQWRREPKTAMYVIEILQMNQVLQQQNKNCLGVCQNPNPPTDLVMYTENLLKLYEMNSKIQLTEGDQIGIFKDIIQGIDILSQKFGQFIPSKDSVGYNAKKRGKVWINNNFCSNNLQQKRIVKSKEQRLRWQVEVISTIVDICKLCTTQNNYKNNKFYFLLEAITNNNLTQFSKVRQFKGPERKLQVQVKKEPSKLSSQIIQNACREVKIADSQNIVSTSEFITILQPKQKQAAHEQYGMMNKTFDFPMVSVRQSNQVSYIPNLTTYKNQTPQKIQFTHKEENIVQEKYKKSYELAYLKQNHKELKKNKLKSYSGQIICSELNFYPKKHLHQLRQAKDKPAHYAELDQLYDSRSSRSESKMVKKQTIPLIDSMQLVQNRHEYDHPNAFHKLRNTVLEESIIFKAPRK